MADRVVNTTDTLNYFRHEFNGTAEDVGDIADILSASSFIASATDVVESVVLINTELPEITTDAFVFPVGTMVFEGSDFNYLDSGNAFETTLAFTDPTADRTYTFPDNTGGVVVDTTAQTLTNKTLTSPVINGGTFSGAFTGTMGMSGVVFDAANALVFEGATDDTNETTLSIVDPTQDRTLTIPNATDTLIGKATTDTLTNKSVDLGDNTLTGTVTEFNSALQSATFATRAGTNTLTNKTFTSPTINGGTMSGSFTGTMDITGTVLSGASPLVFEGATDDTHETTWAFVDPTGDRTITFPNATDTLIGKATTDTLTNKSVDLDANTLTGSLAEFNAALQSATFATIDNADTLTNKTFTSPTINGGTFSGSFTGTLDVTGTVLSAASPLVFEGASADNHETTWAFTDPTTDRTISIPDATDTLIGKATTDTLTNKTFDLDANTLTGSLAEFNAALQGDSFGTLADTLTFTNKTFTNPTITSGVLNTQVTGSAVKDEDNFASNSATVVASQQSIKAYIDNLIDAQDLDLSSDSGSIDVDLDDETLTLAGGTGIASAASGNTVTFNIDSTVATLVGSQTFTNKTFTSPVINALTFSSGQTTSGLNIGANGIIFEGATADAHETTLTVTNPTADKTITIPDASITLLTTATHVNKSVHIARCIALG